MVSGHCLTTNVYFASLSQLSNIVSFGYFAEVLYDQLTVIRPRVGNLLRLLQLSALERKFGSSRRQVVVDKHRIITVLRVVAFQVHTTSIHAIPYTVGIETDDDRPPVSRSLSHLSQSMAAGNVGDGESRRNRHFVVYEREFSHQCSHPGPFPRNHRIRDWTVSYTVRVCPSLAQSCRPSSRVVQYTHLFHVLSL